MRDRQRRWKGGTMDIEHRASRTEPGLRRRQEAQEQRQCPVWSRNAEMLLTRIEFRCCRIVCHACTTSVVSEGRAVAVVLAQLATAGGVSCRCFDADRSDSGRIIANAKR